MTSDRSHPETDESETLGTTSTDMASTLLTPGQDDETCGGNGGLSMPEAVVGDGAKSTVQDVAKFADDIKNLKKMLLELEQQAKVASSTGTEQESAPEKRRADLEEYKRMEECLYKHRKEWEVAGGPGGWNLWSFSDYFKSGRHERRWELNPDKNYTRPDPFDHSHDCSDSKNEVAVDAHVDFDRDIDYGRRRERLRKNFEWDMDRLYLAEETDKRRRYKDKPAEEGEKEAEKGDETNEDSSPTFSEPKLNRISWSGFKQLRGVGEEKSCVLDILIGEPTIDDDAGDYRRWYGYSGHRSRKVENIRDRKVHETNEIGQAALPERIRIHSNILRHILATILGSQGEPLITNPTLSVVLVRPFKAIFHCRGALQDWYTALEKKLNAASETEKIAILDGVAAESSPDLHELANDTSLVLTGKDTAAENASTEESTVIEPVKQVEEKLEDGAESDGQGKIEGQKEDEEEEEEEGEEGENDEKLDEFTKSPAALEHLRCLLDFVNSDISKRLDYLNGPQCRKVFFSDLWLLFRPGMEVIGADGKQAYRVIGVTSAKHRVAAPWERWYNNLADDKRKTSPFSVTCIYIDFDGKNLGPVTKIFDFKRFDGEKDVTLLEVYPLHLHPVRQSDFDNSMWAEVEALPPSQRYRQRLIRRGAMFLEVAAVKHMYYAGPTLEVRDDVEGQVVIDFETAFSVEDEAQKRWKPALQTLIGNPSTEEDEESSSDIRCRGGCCEGDFVHDDTFVDEKQKTDYINSLLPKGTSLNEQPSVAIFPRSLKELRAGPDNVPHVSDDELVIMSYRVFGFVLRNRKWGKWKRFSRFINYIVLFC